MGHVVVVSAGDDIVPFGDFFFERDFDGLSLVEDVEEATWRMGRVWQQAPRLCTVARTLSPAARTALLISRPKPREAPVTIHVFSSYVAPRGSPASLIADRTIYLPTLRQCRKGNEIPGK